jgi:hypothetical protein
LAGNNGCANKEIITNSKISTLFCCGRKAHAGNRKDKVDDERILHANI